ncbi:MAG: hypothetical protein ACRYG6_07680 [Janthinobacterium lividum]
MMTSLSVRKVQELAAQGRMPAAAKLGGLNRRLQLEQTDPRSSLRPQALDGASDRLVPFRQPTIGSLRADRATGVVDTANTPLAALPPSGKSEHAT